MLQFHFPSSASINILLLLRECFPVWFLSLIQRWSLHFYDFRDTVLGNLSRPLLKEYFPFILCHQAPFHWKSFHLRAYSRSHHWSFLVCFLCVPLPDVVEVRLSRSIYGILLTIFRYLLLVHRHLFVERIDEWLLLIIGHVSPRCHWFAYSLLALPFDC